MGYATHEIKVLLRLSRHNSPQDEEDNHVAQILKEKIQDLVQDYDQVLWVESSDV